MAHVLVTTVVVRRPLIASGTNLSASRSITRPSPAWSYVGVDVFIVSILSFETRCLISASSPV